MPVVIAGLGDLAFALLTLALAAAIGTFGKFLASFIPSVPVIGGAIRNGVRDATDAAGKFLMDLSHSSWSRLRDIINGINWLDHRLAHVLLNVLEHHAGLISVLYNDTIPQAASNAQTQAENHADSLARSLQDNIDAATGQEAHDVGALQDNIDKVREYVDGAFLTSVDASISAAEHGAEAQAHSELVAAVGTLQGYMTGLQDQVNQLDNLAEVVLPAEITAAVQASYNREQANLVATAQSLQSELDALQSELNTANAAIAANQAAIASAEANIARLSTDVTANAAAIAAANGEITIARGNIDTLTQQVDTANTAIDNINGQIDSLNAKQAIDNQNIGALQDVTTVAIPATIAAVAASVAAITAEYDECAVTNCDPASPNNIGNVLRSLLTGLEDAAEIGFVAEAIRDPEGTGNLIAGTLEAVEADASSALTALLSL